MGDSKLAKPGPLGLYSDAARRISDTVTMHLLADPEGNVGQWLAFALADGRCDPTLYERRHHAVITHGMFARNYGYLKIPPNGCSAKSAEAFLEFSRRVADNPNLRWKALREDADTELILPMRLEDLLR